MDRSTAVAWSSHEHMRPDHPDRDRGFGGTKKIADLPRHETCLSPNHNPPNMMVYSDGVYEHICSACGHRTIFTVRNPFC